MGSDPHCRELVALARLGRRWCRKIAASLGEIAVYPTMQALRRQPRHRLLEAGGYVCLAAAFIGLLSLPHPVKPLAKRTTAPPAARPARPAPEPRQLAPMAPTPPMARVERPTPPPPLPAPAKPERVNEVARLRARYLTAREKCLARLHDTPDYQSALADAERLEAEVRLLRSRDAQAELRRVSVDWIQAKSVVSTMTSIALGADPDVQEAEMVLRGLGLMRAPYPTRASTASHTSDSRATEDAELSSSSDPLSVPLPTP
jgi:hypothetical protein